MKENGPLSRSIDGWDKGFVVFKYIAVFTVN